jgi:hypothetical protein
MEFFIKDNSLQNCTDAGIGDLTQTIAVAANCVGFMLDIAG